MRHRELVNKLIEIKCRPWSAPIFVSRAEVLRFAEQERARQQELTDLLPEIIEKLQRRL